MKKLWLILIVVLSISVCAGVGTAIGVNRANVVAPQAIADAIEDLAKRDEIKPVVNMLESGSIELSGNANVEDVVPMFGINGTLDLGAKINFGKKAIFLQNVHVKANSEDLGVDIDLGVDAYFSNELSYIKNDTILDGAYGIIEGEMADAFEDSTLFEGMIDDDLKAAITRALEFYDDGELDDVSKDLKKFANKYSKIAVKSLRKNAEFDKSTKKLEIGGDTLKSRVITVTITKDTVIAVLEDLYDKLESDKKLRKFFINNADKFDDLIAYNLGRDDINVEEYYDELIKELANLIEDMRSEDYGDFTYVIGVVTPKGSSTLRMLTLGDEDGTYLEIDFGKKGVKKADRIEITVDDSEIYVYDITANTKKEYSATLTQTYNKEDAKVNTVFTIKVDKANDTFSVVVDDVTVSGTWTTKSKTTTITANSVTIGEETYDGFEVTLIVKQKEKMPKPVATDDITNICNLTSDDLAEIIEKVMGTFGSVALPME